MEVAWFASIKPNGAKNLNETLAQTKEGTLTKEKALNELQKMLVKALIKKMATSPTAEAIAI